MSDLKVFSQELFVSEKNYDRNKIYYGFIHNYSSMHTRDSYLRDLKLFLDFISNHFKKMNEVSVEHAHVVAFKDYLIKNDYSQRSINRALACLWSFYDYLMDMNLIDRNPIARVKRFRLAKEVKTQDLSNEETIALLESINTESGSGKLHKALMTLFFTTGMRHREVSHLKFKNLDEENGLTVVRYFAKGAQEMVTPINPKALDALSDYLKWCEIEGYRFTPEDYIFRPAKNNLNFDVNKPLNPKTLNYIIKRYAKKAGVKGKVSIHSARSTVIGTLLEKGHPLERVADFVGHKDITMTKAYNKRRVKIRDSLSFDL